MTGDRFADALAAAAEWHRDQVRKGTRIPYVGHLLEAAAIVLQAGAGEDVAIAALLHDAIEDQRERSGGAAGIERRFGRKVAEIVVACSDSDPAGREERDAANWRSRKEHYLAVLPTKSGDALLVSLADKIANARAIVHDLRTSGFAVWDRFHGGKDGTLWYYRSLSDGFSASPLQETQRPLVDEFRDLVRTMQSLA